MAAAFHLQVDQGADYTLVIPVLGDGNVPVNVDGWAAAGQIRSRATSTAVLADLDPSPEGTAVVLRIPRDTSSAWTFRTGVYDIELTAPDGLTTTRLLQGLVVVRPEVTR